MIQPQHSPNNISSPPLDPPPQVDLRTLPSPPPSLAASSAKLSALHARLSLPQRLPIETLARCLIDPSADPDPTFNNASLTILGGDLVAYHTAELILCRYPRLPSEVVFAAMRAYCGSKAIAAIAREWGVEVAAEPGGEVDSGYLQCKRREPGNAEASTAPGMWVKELGEETHYFRTWRRGASSRAILDDEFEIPTGSKVHNPAAKQEANMMLETTGVTVEQACAQFVRALTGAMYLHAGKRAAKMFVKEHVLSRRLDVGRMFEFKQPTRDLSRLCAREGFPSPVARILSETGRRSRHPVFVVGVFAGKDKLGEGAGSSLDEARIRASVGALKGWYLYSPLGSRVPSDAEGPDAKPWEAVLVDGGEVIV